MNGYSRTLNVYYLTPENQDTSIIRTLYLDLYLEAPLKPSESGMGEGGGGGFVFGWAFGRFHVWAFSTRLKQQNTPPTISVSLLLESGQLV